MRGQVWLALLYSNGQLPATVLCNARAVSRWCRDYDPHIVSSMSAIWKKLSPELQSHLGRGGVCYCFSVRTHSKYVMRLLWHEGWFSRLWALL